MATSRIAGQARSVLRTMFVWLAVSALVLSSAFATAAHADHADHAAALHSMLTGDLTPDDPATGSPAEHGCHCCCQHFGGVIAAVPLLALPLSAPVQTAAVPPASISVDPAAPRRPPKA